MTGLAGRTILVVEDELVILLDLKTALEQAGARVVSGPQHVDDRKLSAAVLDHAMPLLADLLTERTVPFVFYSGREPDDFARWPHAPVFTKPASPVAIVSSLVRLLEPEGRTRSEAAASRPSLMLPRDLLITDELRERRTRSNTSAGQVRAFHDLTELVMRSPDAVVQRLLDLAVDLCGAGSAGWSRLGRNAAGEEVFWWDVLAGEFAPHVGGTTPRNFSPCGLCVDAGKTILVSRPARAFTYFNDVDVPIVEALIVPVYDANRAALGTIWVVSHNDHKFDASDARAMEQLSAQLALALKLVADAKRQDQELSGQVALMQDANHRIKNTFQSIASLLNLQARSSPVPEARAAIEQAGTRLGVFGLVHEMLTSNRGDNRAVDIGEVIEKLVSALRATRFDSDRRISLRVHADPVLLEPGIALPVSLLINEAITNAYKYAYPGALAGEIFVRVARTAAGGLRIGIQDDGVGFSPDSKGGLGLKLMRGFASQVGGELLVDSDAGTTIQLTIDQLAAERAMEPHILPTIGGGERSISGTLIGAMSSGLVLTSYLP